MTDSPVSVLLAIETSNGGFYQKDGRPVWPVRNAGERDALERMVGTLGGTLEFVSDADEAPLSGPELVVGLGPGVREHARLYAHLTQRHCVTLERIEELDKVASIAVVVTTFANVTEDLLDLLYDGERMGRAPGLIFSYADEDLSLQVLTRSAALQCGHTGFRHRRIDVNPTIDFGVEASPEYTFLGGRAKPSELREALSCTAGLLSLYTHSDGIDAYLREDLVLCPIEDIDGGAGPGPLPSCVISGICHRCRRPMREVIGSDVLLAPEIVRAHVFIFSACWGLYPPRGIHSPGFSLARRFLESFSVGALITSWEINLQGLPVTARLFHDVARGLPLGEALAQHLCSEEARRTHHKLCLIGDPAIRLMAADVKDPLEGIQSIGRLPAPSERCMAGLALLRLMVHHFAQEGDDSVRVLRTISEYETMLAGRRAHDAPLSARFRVEVADYLATQDTMLSKSWAQFVDQTQVLPHKPPCPICRRRSVARLSSLRIPGAMSRRETMCPSCGSVEDTALDREIAITVQPDGVVQLHGMLPESDWQARIVVERFFTRETRSWTWPAASTGEPSSSFRVPEPWPVVPFRLAVIMVHGDSEFCVLGCLYRGLRASEQ